MSASRSPRSTTSTAFENWYRRVSRCRRSEDQEPGDVEIVQHEQRQVVIAADGVDQPPRRSDGHALGRDDHQVIAVGEVHRLEQRAEPFLFAEQDGAEVPGRTDDVDDRRPQSWRE